MGLNVRMLRRDNSSPLDFPEVSLEPTRYSWHKVGGPEVAEIRAYGGPWAVWELLNWLRAPVEIRDERGKLVWWGYVSEITVSAGAMELGLTIETMANKVAVLYQDLAAGATSWAWTDWAQDADSIAEYGTFELVKKLGQGTEEMAEGYRDQLLEELKWPSSVMRHRARSSGSGATEVAANIRCRGWWFSLGWEYYADDTESDEVTTTQIETIAGGAQYITGTDIKDASGISTSQLQDGTATILQIVQTLLSAGVSGGGQLVAVVTEDRIFRVYEEDTTEALYLQGDGRVEDAWGNEWVNAECPVAQWTVLRDVIPPTVITTQAPDPSRFFVDRSEYNVQTGQLVLEPRGAVAPWARGGGAGLSMPEGTCPLYCVDTENTYGGCGAAASLNTSYAAYNTILGFAAGATATTDDYLTLFGHKAGNALDMTSENTYLGAGCGQYASSGSNNTGCGAECLMYNVDGENNAALGIGALLCYYTGTRNPDEDVAIGSFAMSDTTTASYCVAVGADSLYYNRVGNYNLAGGYKALRGTSGGSQTNMTAVGAYAGHGAVNNQTGCVYLGYMAGYSETGNNKLYIENSNSATPLIYGEFDNDEVGINVGSACAATLHVDQASATGAKPVLYLDQGDEDEELVRYDGTSAADQTKSISTVNGDGSVEGPKNYASAAGWAFEGMIRINVNGTDYWAPYYSADTS